jgi:hypothetical protein
MTHATPLENITVEGVEDTLFGPLVRQVHCKGGPVGENLEPARLSLYVEGPGIADLRKVHTVNVVLDEHHYHGVVRHVSKLDDGLVMDIETA